MQSLHLDVDASKGRPEEVEKAHYVLLNQIDTYRSYGGETILLAKKAYSSGGEVTENLASELKNVDCNSFFYHIDNCCLCAQSKGTAAKCVTLPIYQQDATW